jgi:hypothetical protein
VEIDSNSFNENEGDKEKSTEADYGRKRQEELKKKIIEKSNEESIRTVNKIF